MERRTYTVTEAATVLGISRTSAYERVRAGELPALRLGRRIVIARAVIDAFVSGSAGTDDGRDPRGRRLRHGSRTRAQPSKQRGKALGDRLPESIEVELEVVMGEEVAGSGRLRPRHVGVAGARLLGDRLRRFADDLDELHQRELEHAVVVEVGTGAPRDEFRGLLARLDHVRDAIVVTRQRHTPAPLRRPRGRGTCCSSRRQSGGRPDGA